MLRTTPRCHSVFLVFVAAAALLAMPATASENNKTQADQNIFANNGDCNDKGESNSNRLSFTIPLPGVQSSIWPDGSVALAIPLRNTSEQVAGTVRIIDMQVPSGQRLDPATLPVMVGDMIPDQTYKVDGRFSLERIGMQYPIILRGTYVLGDNTCKFQVQAFFVPRPPNNAPVTATKGTVLKVTPGTASYPPPPPPPGPEKEFNAFSILPPIGPPRNFFPSPPGSTALDRTAAFNLLNTSQFVPLNLTLKPLNADPPDPNSVVFIRNTVGANYGGFPPDPSVAGNDQNDVVMFTANTAVSYSIDSGLTFKTLNLTSLFDPAIPSRNSFFPQDDGGLCCDQVLNYIPSRNIFVWLLQYWAATIGTDSSGKPITGPNRLRIAWATPQGIRSDFLHAWTWVDLTSAGVGIGNDWMDFPDLAYSNNFVYVGVDHGIQNTGSVYTGRHLFMRLSLDDIVNPNVPYVTYWYMDPSHDGLWQNHIAQSSPDTFYWTAMPNTSTMTVYSWADSSGTAYPHDVAISSYSNSDFSILTPENIDFSASPKLTLGATVVDPPTFCPPGGCTGPTRFLYFAFSAGRNGSARPFPYVRVEKIDRDSFNLVSELDIWNPSFGFVMPTLVWRPGNREDVALSLAVGGGGSFADNAVGFLGDYVVYVTTDSDTTHAGYARDNKGNIIYNNGQPTYSVRFGDYYSLRNSVGPLTANGRGVGYSTLGYASKTNVSGQKCVDVGCSIAEHYVQFGRYGELIPNPPPPPPR
jgi:hypothetical protein